MYTWIGRCIHGYTDVYRIGRRDWPEGCLTNLPRMIKLKGYHVTEGKGRVFYERK